MTRARRDAVCVRRVAWLVVGGALLAAADWTATWLLIDETAEGTRKVGGSASATCAPSRTPRRCSYSSPSAAGGSATERASGSSRRRASAIFFSGLLVLTFGLALLALLAAKTAWGRIRRQR
jgi:hypothetical protein